MYEFIDNEKECKIGFGNMHDYFADLHEFLQNAKRINQLTFS
jgi:hypothetical protein